MFKLTDPFAHTQLSKFPFATEKPVMIDEHVSKYNLDLGFNIPNIKKYDEYGNPVAHLRRYYNQLGGAGRKEELFIAYFWGKFSSFSF